MRQKANRIAFITSDSSHTIHLIEWKMPLMWDLGEVLETATGDVDLEWEKMLTHYMSQGKDHTHLSLVAAVVASEVAITKGRIIWVTQEEEVSLRDEELRAVQDERRAYQGDPS